MISDSRRQTVLDFAVVFGALATIPITVLQEQGVNSWALLTMDWAIWGIFALEFLFLAVFSPRTTLFRSSTVIKFAVGRDFCFPYLPSLLALVQLSPG